MQMNDMILVSVDDHIIEPANLFERHVSAKYKDQAPRVVTFRGGEQRWKFQDRLIPTIASCAVSGRKREELGAEASNYEDMRSGCYDSAARVADMNANGVLSSVCFPTMTGFAGQLFLDKSDPDLMLAMIRAYNDWHVQDWCGPHPGRFIPLGFVPLWDTDLAIAEIERMARMGVRTVCLPENPSALGLPSIHRDYWLPVLDALVDHDMVVSIHIGTAGPPPYPSMDTPQDWFNSVINLLAAHTMADWVFSPVLRKVPDLRIALSEGCMGWVPFMLERVDAAYDNHRFWTYQNLGELRPSDLIKRHFMFCFHEDQFGLEQRHKVGIDRIGWECDYPHCDSTWPTSPEKLWEQVNSFPAAEIERISHANALDFFKFDPFVHVPREQATVGALRALAAGHDTSERSLGGSGRHPELDPELNVLTARALQNLHEQLNKLEPAE